MPPSRTVEKFLEDLLFLIRKKPSDKDFGEFHAFPSFSFYVEPPNDDFGDVLCPETSPRSVGGKNTCLVCFPQMMQKC